MVAILLRATELFRNFGRGSPKEHKIILKLGHWPARICHLSFKVFFSIFSSGGHFVQRAKQFY